VCFFPKKKVIISAECTPDIVNVILLTDNHSLIALRGLKSDVHPSSSQSPLLFVLIGCVVQCGNAFNNELTGHTIENLSLEFWYNIDLGFSEMISNFFYFCYLFPFRG